VLRGEPIERSRPRDVAAGSPVTRRCPVKDVKGRIGDASIARIEIDDAERRT
jgi:hypothetical protein